MAATSPARDSGEALHATVTRALEEKCFPKTLTEALATFWSFSSPWILSGIALGCVLVRLMLGGWGLWDAALVPIVFFFWAFQEWSMHQWLLHMRPRKIFGRTLDPYFAKQHRYHHERPWDISSVFLEAPFLFQILPVAIVLWVLLMPTLSLAMTGMATYAVMALLYEWTHFLTHTAYRPSTKLYRRIQKNHRLHHFKNEHYWHGFIIPHIDTLLGTDPDPTSVPKSPTCMDILGEKAAAS